MVTAAAPPRAAGPPQEGGHGEALASESSGDGAHGQHPDHFAVFVGITDHDGEDEWTLGADYERRLSPRFGVGGLVDYAGGDLRALVAAASVVYHPTARIKLLGGVGIDYENTHDETEPLLRLGATYDFPVGRCTVSPTIDVDFVDGDQIYVYGVNFGIGF